MVLNIHLWQVLLAGDSGSLIECLPVTFNGAPNLHVADNLGSAYLEPFIHSKLEKVLILSK